MPPPTAVEVMNSHPWHQKSVLISGAARGIGRCLARRFLERGHRVYLFDIDEEELTHCASVHLKQYSKNLGYSICDLRDANDMRSSVKKAAEFFGGHIDVLINNGGIATPYWKEGKTMEDERTLEEWRAYMDANLTAPFVVSQACIPYMKTASEEDSKHVHDAGPCIIHIGSFRAHQSDSDQEGYASTKAGQLGLMHSMAVSCERWGIRVNLIAPGRIKVAHESKAGDESGGTWEEQLEDRDYEQHPSNRAGRPMDIADAAEYLVGAGFVTGQDITVDGGALRKKNK